MRANILLVDDHTLVREGIKALMEQINVELVGEAADGNMAVKLARKLLPDIIVMDVMMPVLNGIDATSQIVAELPDVKVLALSGHFDKDQIVEMLKAGASGFLLKTCTTRELSFAIETVMTGQSYLTPSIADMVLKDYVHGLSMDSVSDSSILSGREREVLQMVAEGHTSKEIASRLYLSPKTVEIHRQKIMDKLGVHNIAALTKHAIRIGLTSLEN